jgi:hypothetical protein
MVDEPVEIADATLIATYLAQVDWARVYMLDTRRYAADYLSAGMADRLSWAQFAGSVPAVFRGTLHGGGLDVLVVPKSLTWSDQDVNAYVGSDAGTRVRSCLDLTEPAFVAVFAWHVAVAREVSLALGHDVYVTHGFNPHDTSPDAHSVAAKFHTHLHIPDLERRRPVVPSGCRCVRLDRLAGGACTGPCDDRFGVVQGSGEFGELRFGNGAGVETAVVDERGELAGLLVGGGAEAAGMG